MKPALSDWSCSRSLLIVLTLFGCASNDAFAEEPVAQRADALMQNWVAEAQEESFALAHPVLPVGTQVERVEVVDTIAAAYLRLPASFLENLTEEQCEAVIDSQAGTLRSVEQLHGFAVMAAPLEDPTAEFLPLPAYLPTLEPVPAKPEPASADLRAGGLPTYNPGRPSGALSGRTVFLNPGHGWYYSSNLGRWATQRGNNYGIIEDLSNGESVLLHLAQYFHNAGANVWTCRERDFNTNMVIVDNTAGSPGFSTTGAWSTGTATGTPYGSNYEFASVSSTETAVATYAPNIPEEGNYAVYVWTPSGSNRATDAEVRVNHTGGTTTHVINMQRDGNTWRFLGTYHFDAGRNAAKGAVEVSNAGSDPSKYVIADAVRFGGGMGDYADGGMLSGKPRWEESGAYFPIFMGAWSTPGSTVSSMPRYAEWENESWEDSIYIAWHSNASNGSGHGSSVWVYGPGGPPSPFGEFSGVVGSDSLATRVRDEMRNDLRIAWNDPSWPANLYSAWFGELNPSNNNEMPAILLEVAYHDSPTDTDSILDPRWRDMVARSVYQGTVKWWHNDADGPGTAATSNDTLLPEPPTHLAVENLGAGEVRVSWHVPPFNSGNNLLGDAATGYIVQKSTDGAGFDQGVATAGTSLDISGLMVGETYFFRVIATNDGGQSFPSEVGGARIAANEAPVLVVNGFDRLDRSAMLDEDDPYDSDPMVRERPGRMNTYDYVRTYAAALDSAGVDFDYCSNEAIRDGDVLLNSYPAVIWYLGEEGSVDATFDSAEQSRAAQYLSAGGQMFVSGSEIGWDLDQLGNGTAFYNSMLKAEYASDDANTFSVTPASGSIFDGIASFNFDDGSTIYNVDYPDVIAPMGGSATALTYSGGTGGTAAVVYDGAFRVVTFGFPFESITSPNRRAEVLAAILNFFDLDADDPPPPPPVDIILESRHASGALTSPPEYQEHGAWLNSSVKSTAEGVTPNAGSRFITYDLPSTGTDNADFVPNITVPGRYEVFVTWANGANCYDSLHTIRHYLGETEVLVDQISSGAPEPANYNTWVSLGEYWFDAGQAISNASVNVSEETVTGKPAAGYNQRVYADAVKWVYVSPWPNGDYDGNNRFDLVDFAAWADCMTGPGGSYAAPECVAFDFDLDGDIDLQDFLAAQAAFAD